MKQHPAKRRSIESAEKNKVNGTVRVATRRLVFAQSQWSSEYTTHLPLEETDEWEEIEAGEEAH